MLLLNIFALTPDWVVFQHIVLDGLSHAPSLVLIWKHHIAEAISRVGMVQKPEL